MSCEMVHDWPWGSVGQGFTCRACGAFLSDDDVRAHDPEGHISLVPSKVLDDAYASESAVERKYVFP